MLLTVIEVAKLITAFGIIYYYRDSKFDTKNLLILLINVFAVYLISTTKYGYGNILYVLQILAVASTEELIFRKFIITELERLLPQTSFKTFFAIIISSLLFSLGHYLVGADSIYTLASLLAGLLLSIVYILRRRVTDSILTHFVINLLRHY